MRSVALLLALCAAAAAARESVLEDEWRRFKTEHSRRYASSAEEAERRDIFALNLQSIAAHNAKNLSWTLGVTQFTDLTREEFVERTGLLRQARSFSAELPLAAHRPDGGALPASVDWRAKGAVAPVKDQGRCEGCWAFAATGAMEGLTKIANGELQSLSEEQLRTCSSSLIFSSLSLELKAAGRVHSGLQLGRRQPRLRRRQRRQRLPLGRPEPRHLHRGWV